MSMDPFIFAPSWRLRENVSVRIESLEGIIPTPPLTAILTDPTLKHIGSNDKNFQDYYITAQLFADNKPLSVPIQTRYKALKGNRKWNEWLKLPIRISDCPRSAQLAMTVWEPAGVTDAVGGRRAFGGTTIALFENDNNLKKGKQKCKLWLGKEADGLADTSTSSVSDMTDEIERLEKQLKRQELGEILRSEWLDQLVFREIERMNSNAKREEIYLVVEFPRYDYPVVYADYEYPSKIPKPVQTVQGHPVKEDEGSDEEWPNHVWDPEAEMDNPCELKHRRLVRSHRNGPLDKELKPNAKIRDELHEIMKYSPTQDLTSGEKDLLWKFRYYLTRDKRALTKFLKSVSWQEAAESKQAVELLPQWTEIDVDDALELLGPQFENPAVRAYAVQRLKKADDEELQLYLLQLVQALKFEKVPENPEAPPTETSLAGFLISRASVNSILGSYFYWYLMVECEDKLRKGLFQKVAYDFQLSLAAMADGVERRAMLKRQADFIFLLSEFSRTIRESKEDRPKKQEKLRQFLADPTNELAAFEPMPLPVDPTINVVGCYPEESIVFKSSLSPILIYLKTSDGTRHPVMFKAGDDLRQDQLVIQIVILMDKLLRKENLDLKLTPYRVLATSVYTGVMQFIPSISLASSLEAKNGGSVLGYLRRNNPDENADLGVKAEVMDTYIKSCAGYCVITYILGVGDRHLDNLLITPDGHFLHADFGFILGRDPKPFAPSMKLCKEMIDGMGGLQSPHFARFKSYCYTAYTTLRKSSNLILNLFALMVESDLPDIRFEPDKAAWKVRERFKLEMSDEEAVRALKGVIEESMNALVPIVIDRIHGLAQMWKR
ncbi:kinase-like domain-containing protein [Peziza echinospora]|nr:kinase-like domain-containing protein [Peziza echinospora]